MHTHTHTDTHLLYTQPTTTLNKEEKKLNKKKMRKSNFSKFHSIDENEQLFYK